MISRDTAKENKGDPNHGVKRVLSFNESHEGSGSPGASDKDSNKGDVSGGDSEDTYSPSKNGSDTDSDSDIPWIKELDGRDKLT